MADEAEPVAPLAYVESPLKCQGCQVGEAVYWPQDAFFQAEKGLSAVVSRQEQAFSQTASKSSPKEALGAGAHD